MTLTHSEKQLVLFTKGWFKEQEDHPDLILKKITAKAWRQPVGLITDFDTYNFVVNVFFKLKDEGLIEVSEKDFLKYHIFGWSEKEVSLLKMTNKLMAWISGVEVITLDLGKIDLTILD